MKQLLILLLVIFLAGGCGEQPIPQVVQPTPLSKEEVLAFIKKYDNAWNAKDTVTVDSVLGSTYTYFTSTGGLTPRTRTLEIVGVAHYKVLQAHRSELEVWIDGNTAIVSSRWQGNGLWENKPFKDNQRCGLVIQKQADGLKLLSEHCVEIQKDSTW